MIATRLDGIQAAIADRREVTCNTCGARCFWSRTLAGRPLLLDLAPHPAGDIVIMEYGPDPQRASCTCLWASPESHDPLREFERFVPHRRTCRPVTR